MLRSLWPLFALQLVLTIWALVDLARRKSVRYLPKAAWTLIILFVSTIGPIIYLAAGRGEE
ncbi:MAG: PLDc_N domain-containing protein [Limnochordales bacterium]|nr:PLDc_N domain-containing protein [Limnochordales bacterium]